jgi:hypothetical protein
MFWSERPPRQEAQDRRTAQGPEEVCIRRSIGLNDVARSKDNGCAEEIVRGQAVGARQPAVACTRCWRQLSVRAQTVRRVEGGRTTAEGQAADSSLTDEPGNSREVCDADAVSGASAS